MLNVPTLDSFLISYQNCIERLLVRARHLMMHRLPPPQTNIITPETLSENS